MGQKLDSKLLDTCRCSEGQAGLPPVLLRATDSEDRWTLCPDGSHEVAGSLAD